MPPGGFCVLGTHGKSYVAAGNPNYPAASHWFDLQLVVPCLWVPLWLVLKGNQKKSTYKQFGGSPKKRHPQKDQAFSFQFGATTTLFFGGIQ